MSAAVLLVLAWVPRVAIGDKPRLIAPVFALPRRAQNSVAAVAATGLAALVIWPALPASTARISLPSLPFAGSPPIEGKAQVLAGGTLRVGGQLVRLAGIEAPERDQKCALTGGRTWSCGRGAEVELSRLARGKAVKCDVKGKDEAGATLAACDAGGVDLGAALVRGGHVFAVEGMFAPYTADEADAKARKVGLWKGNPERPAVARAKAWDAAKAKAPDGCPIKGHVVSGARVYVLPWDPEYGRRSVQKSRGERWFCSEEEAQGAGWKLVGKG
ncbi:MAG TPA: thermonuclease family protein [Hyphomicrobiaceae bacterium]|nr:thermonuclease family protein [Hyphomicrobiaceae bacterium]